MRAHPETRGATSATGKLGRKLRVLLGDLNLCPCSLSIGEGVDDLAFGARELGGALKVLEGAGHIVLLEQELGHGRDCNIALGIDCIMVSQSIMESR